ncbi:MAG TPA: hypothetical protein PK708_08505 [Candidatus Competibacter sp.]|nr:hypothetical protein [Candidatus Competibacter sp.]
MRIGRFRRSARLFGFPESVRCLALDEQPGQRQLGRRKAILFVGTAVIAFQRYRVINDGAGLNAALAKSSLG